MESDRYEKCECMLEDDYSYEEADTRGADLLRELRYGYGGFFWADTYDGENVVLLGSATEGTNRMETKDADGYQMVKEIIRVGQEPDGGYTDYVFPKEGETESSPKRSYSRAFEPFGWVVGTGNYIDYIDETVAKETQAMKENVKSALLAIIGMGSFLVVIVMAVCLYMAFSLSRSFQVAQIQKVTEEVTSSVAQLSSDAEQLLAFVGKDVVASYDTFDEAADAYGIPSGVFVSQVTEGGAAEQAGITANSIITAFDGKSVSDISELKSRLEYYKAGEEVEVTLQVPDGNGYTEKNVTVTLGKADSSTSGSSLQSGSDESQDQNQGQDPYNYGGSDDNSGNYFRFSNSQKSF